MTQNLLYPFALLHAENPLHSGVPHFTPLKAQDNFPFSLALCGPVYLALEVMAHIMDDDDLYTTYCDVAKGKKWTGNQQSSLRILEWQNGKLRMLHFKLRARCLRAVKGA